jgi:hypothetical protein
MPGVSYSEPLRFGVFKYGLSSSGGLGDVNPLLQDVPGVGKLGVKLVRHPVSWECFEPQKGIFDTKGCSQIKAIDKLLSSGIQVQMSIRTAVRKGSNLNEFWATGRVPSGDSRKIPSRPPLDLTSNRDEKYGYSKSYYEFISGLLDHYCRGAKCSISEICIENEANSDKFWISTGSPSKDVEDYVKIVKTAKKVVTDRNLPVKVYDSGLQGWTLPFLAMQEAANRGDYSLASSIFYSVHQKMIEKQKLLKILENRMKEPSIMRTALMLKSDLYQTIDGLNFHYYQPIESLPYTVDFLRRSIPSGKQLVSNEVGIKEKFLNGNSRKLTLPDMIIMETLTLFSFGVNPVVWFSEEAQENVAHMVNKSGVMSADNSRAVQKITQMLDGATAVKPVQCANGKGFLISGGGGESKVCFDSEK